MLTSIHAISCLQDKLLIWEWMIGMRINLLKLSNYCEIILLSNLFTASLRICISYMHGHHIISLISISLKWYKDEQLDLYWIGKTDMPVLGWPSLQSRRTKDKSIVFYKIINNVVDVGFDDHLLMPATPYYTRCHLTQPYTRVDAYKYSFLPSAIKLWNTLPGSLINQEIVNHFQDKLHLAHLYMYINTPYKEVCT